MDPKCIFCKIISGEVPSYKLYEDENIIAILDINPVYKGHLLVIPKEHVSKLVEMEEKTLMDFLNSFRKVLEIVESKISKNYNIVINQGKKALQEIEHLHIHIIPRDLEKETNEEKLFKWKTHSLTKEEAEEILSLL